MRYAYQRAGGPIIDWKTGIPRQTRAADAVSLGSLAGSTLDTPTLVLPAPGAPEPIGVTRAAMGGCSCSGSCGCGPKAPLADIADAVPGGYLTLAIGAFIAWRVLAKKRRR